MFDLLRREYDRLVRSYFEQRGGHIENKQPRPDVIKVETTAAISAIFDRDARRQEAEYNASLMRRRIPESNAQLLGESSFGTESGIEIIHPPRRDK
jgi:hypothetical protein